MSTELAIHFDNKLIGSPITADDVKLVEHENLGETYRSVMTVKGKKFKRLMGRGRPFLIIWHDEEYQLGDILMIDNKLYHNILEYLFQTYCVTSVEIESTRRRPSRG